MAHSWSPQRLFGTGNIIPCNCCSSCVAHAAEGPSMDDSPKWIEPHTCPDHMFSTCPPCRRIPQPQSRCCRSLRQPQPWCIHQPNLCGASTQQCCPVARGNCPITCKRCSVTGKRCPVTHQRCPGAHQHCPGARQRCSGTRKRSAGAWWRCSGVSPCPALSHIQQLHLIAYISAHAASTRSASARQQGS